MTSPIETGKGVCIGSECPHLELNTSRGKLAEASVTAYLEGWCKDKDQCLFEQISIVEPLEENA
jgi:hypothetical protein